MVQTGEIQVFDPMASYVYISGVMLAKLGDAMM